MVWLSLVILVLAMLACLAKVRLLAWRRSVFLSPDPFEPPVLNEEFHARR